MEKRIERKIHRMRSYKPHKNNNRKTQLIFYVFFLGIHASRFIAWYFGFRKYELFRIDIAMNEKKNYNQIYVLSNKIKENSAENNFAKYSIPKIISIIIYSHENPFKIIALNTIFFLNKKVVCEIIVDLFIFRTIMHVHSSKGLQH